MVVYMFALIDLTASLLFVLFSSIAVVLASGSSGNSKIGLLAAPARNWDIWDVCWFDHDDVQYVRSGKSSVSDSGRLYGHSCPG